MKTETSAVTVPALKQMKADG
ncbi:MAG: hypothetical protein QOF32_1123, partial [Gammaproteobacteria bacterium]|nr:hypothetical protein [Gammaproteobacteria bacterium]